MTYRQLDKLPNPKKVAIRWFTPVHRLFVIGKGDNGLFYASRGPEPKFIVEAENQSDAEYEAGRLINAHITRIGRGAKPTG